VAAVTRARRFLLEVVGNNPSDRISEEDPMTGPTPTPVTTALDLRLVLGSDRAVVVPATFDYDPAEPFAVTATVATAEGDVTWIFARDLLDQGLTEPSGEGDVAVWPSRSHGAAVVCVALSSPSGQALLEADRIRLESFLRLSYQMVPAGEESEHLDLDGALDALLFEEGGLAGG
jgi:hypothetical protein